MAEDSLEYGLAILAIVFKDLFTTPSRDAGRAPATFPTQDTQDRGALPSIDTTQEEQDTGVTTPAQEIPLKYARMFEHRGRHEASCVYPLGDFRGVSSPKEGDTWQELLTREFESTAEKSLTEAREKYRKNLKSRCGIYARGRNSKELLKRAGMKAVRRTIDVCGAKWDLKDGARNLRVLQDLLYYKWTQIESSLKDEILESRRVKRMRKNDDGNGGCGDESPPRPSGGLESLSKERAAPAPHTTPTEGSEPVADSREPSHDPQQVTTRAETARKTQRRLRSAPVGSESRLRPTTAAGLASNNSRPVPSSRPDPQTQGMSRNQGQSTEHNSYIQSAPVTRWDLPDHVRFYLHRWSTEERKTVEIGPANLMREDMCISELWSQSCMMKGRSHSSASGRREPDHADLFPDLTRESRFELFCLAINNNRSKSVLLTGLPDSLRHCWDTATRTWGGSGSTPLPEVHLLLFDTSLSKEVLMKFFPRIWDVLVLDF